VVSWTHPEKAVSRLNSDALVTQLPSSSLLKGAKLIGANSDVSGPIENGIAPACRALIAPIEMATGTQAYFCGKPNPLMMRTGLNMLGCHSAEAVMVGDRRKVVCLLYWFSLDVQRRIHSKLMLIFRQWY
jgi:ribonucleotide monophosphatase NagD (HAD superfamily)